MGRRLILSRSSQDIVILPSTTSVRFVLGMNSLPPEPPQVEHMGRLAQSSPHVGHAGMSLGAVIPACVSVDVTRLRSLLMTTKKKPWSAKSSLQHAKPESA